jgi:hypothetical protein
MHATSFDAGDVLFWATQALTAKVRRARLRAQLTFFRALADQVERVAHAEDNVERLRTQLTEEMEEVIGRCLTLAWRPLAALLPARSGRVILGAAFHASSALRSEMIGWVATLRETLRGRSTRAPVRSEGVRTARQPRSRAALRVHENVHVRGTS